MGGAGAGDALACWGLVGKPRRILGRRLFISVPPPLIPFMVPNVESRITGRRLKNESYQHHSYRQPPQWPASRPAAADFRSPPKL